jgi:hypothetical protein
MQPMISSSSGSYESLGVGPYDDAAQQTRLIDAARLHRLEQAGERVEELQALHVAAEVVDQHLRDVEQRRNGCCARNMLSTNRQRQEHMTVSSAIATLIPGRASSMLSTRLPSLRSGASSGKCQTHAMLEVAQKAPPHTRRLIARVEATSASSMLSPETGKAARHSTRFIDSTQ